MSRLTAAEWEVIEKSLSHPYGRGAELLIDGYRISLSVEMEKTLRYVIVVYVNGCWTGKMLSNDCEERRRFMRPVRTNFCSKKLYDLERKISGKNAAEALKRRMSGKYYMPTWPRFGALKRHLITNNTSIALVPQEQRA